ncbi:MAG: cysteine desulfurase family protein [Oscillospiraceae bacterium]
MQQIYLDNAATTRVSPEAARVALEIMTENYGNPSSSHTMGRAAKAALDNAREQVAAALGASDPSEIFFTSGGTESDNWAILAGAESMRRRGKHVISSLAEHDAVRKALDELESRGFEVTRLAPEDDGSISVRSVAEALRKDTVLVSLMMVNNETGAITDIAAIAREIKKSGSPALLHTDAIQAFLKVPFSAKTLGADLISVSGHKIHAPKGVGALYVRSGLKLAPIIFGGGQERGYRSGTEGLPQICAFGEAARTGRELMEQSIEHMNSLRQLAIGRLTAENPGLLVIGGGAPHIISLSLPGYKSEVLMNFLEAKGIYISKSSACKRGARSHVLEAMGLKNEVLDGAIRVSLSRYTTREEIEIFCDAIKEARESLFRSPR